MVADAGLDVASAGLRGLADVDEVFKTPLSAATLDRAASIAEHLKTRTNILTTINPKHIAAAVARGFVGTVTDLAKLEVTDHERRNIKRWTEEAGRIGDAMMPFLKQGNPSSAFMAGLAAASWSPAEENLGGVTYEQRMADAVRGEHFD